MSGKSSSLAPRPRNSENKLYQACLDACIEGFQRLPVNKRWASATVNSYNNTVTADFHANITTPDRTVTPPIQPETEATLISPPATPKRASSPPPLRSSASITTMNRSPLHGAPIRSNPPPSRVLAPACGTPLTCGNQDARSNLAVQPAANAGSFRLKKNAVKIVGAAAPAPSTPFRAVPPAPTPALTTSASPIPGPVKAKPKEAEGPKLAKPTSTPAAPGTAPKSTPPEIELLASSSAGESALDELFARLNARSPSVTSSTAKAASPARPPEKGQLLFDDGSGDENRHLEILKSYTASLPTTPARAKESGFTAIPPAQERMADLPNEVAQVKEAKSTARWEGLLRKELEQEYLQKAAEYISVLCAGESVPVQTIKKVLAKLRSSYVPDAKLSTDEVEKLKSRYAFAIVNYANQVLKKSLSAEFAKNALQDADGNLFALCAKLVEEKYISLGDTNGITGLCKAILDILPKAEPTKAPVKTEAKPTAATTSETSPVPKDPVDTLKAWPTQESREAPPAYRACILKGVSGIKSINQLQALVWGGRLESIAMPAPGADWAVVRFLTAEACDKYFKATENGIEVRGDKKNVVFVEKQPAPTSVNDVMRNCADGDASRCVRATDAEEDWSDMLLLKLARGKGTMKREVDRIKRGKTSQNRYYIEFRFATIYHALNFKRQLMEDPDWEPCTIAYATDPCETARGVHYKDKDEEDIGFFA